MAQTDKQVETPVADDKGKDGKNSRVADYLAAPRKKRKSYVLFALSAQTQQNIAPSLENFLRTSFKNVALSMPKTPDEFVKNFSRQLVLIIFDDEFTGLEKGLSLLSDLKHRKNVGPVPVLFLTRDPSALIAAYNRELAIFQEVDDYVNYPKADLPQIYSKVRHALTNQNRRRSRRYQVSLPLTYYLLQDDKMHPGELLDLSVHGALLRANDKRIFRPGDQLKLHLPVAQFLPLNAGDYLKISAKVRRVYIAGDLAGISFEYVSDQQQLTLTKFLTSMVSDQAIRKTANPKARLART